MSLQLNAATSGSTTLVPTDAVTATITLPSTTSTLATVSQIQGPAFAAYLSNATSVSTATVTKLAFDTEVFDTANCYNPSTYRFTPNVAGYYMFNAVTRFGSFTSTQCFLRIYKNGSSFNQGSGSGVSSGYVWPTANWLVYMNGTTDYVEAYAYQTSGSTQSADYGDYYQFTGALIRSA